MQTWKVNFSKMLRTEQAKWRWRRSEDSHNRHPSGCYLGTVLPARPGIAAKLWGAAQHLQLPQHHHTAHRVLHTQTTPNASRNQLCTDSCKRFLWPLGSLKKNNNYVMLTTCSSEAQSPPGEAQLSTAGTRSPWSTTAPWIWPHAGEQRGSLQSPLHQPKPHTCREAAFHQLRSKETSFPPFPGKQKVQASPKVLPAHALGWLFQLKCL